MSIFEKIDSLQQGVSAAWTRNSVIMNNIANVDTPNFKSSSVEFENLYKNALDDESSGFVLKKTRPTHMNIGSGDTDSVTAVVRENSDTTERMDGNNVNVDQEMTDLAKNVIYYTALTRKVSGEFNQLRAAISEGR